MDTSKEKITFPFKCPVCGKSEFNDISWLLDEEKDMEVYVIDSTTGEKRLIDAIEAHDIHCEYCGWMYDIKQVSNHNIVGDRNAKTIITLQKEYQQKIKDDPNFIFDDAVESINNKHKCPICGKYTFKDEMSYDVCKICGWIDDGTETNEDDYSEINKKRITEAKKEFANK